MNAKLRTIHVRVNDAATGQPTPVRIHFSGPDGQYLASLGRLTEIPIGHNEDVGGNLRFGSKRFAYIDGTCEIRLPAGPIQVEIHKGPEYTPRIFEEVLGAGQLALRYSLERWIDLRREGWYSGDINAHLTPHAALLEGAAEDLAVVNVLVMDTDFHSEGERSLQELVFSDIPHGQLPIYQVFPNILAFSGQRPALEMPGHLVVVNTHNTHHSLGSLHLLNCHRLVFPIAIEEEEGVNDVLLADWCDQCHRKGGLVVGVDLFHIDEAGQCYGEILADLILGKVDAMALLENMPLNDHLDKCWYVFLNFGCRVPLVGGSGKSQNNLLLGSPRTYARLQPGQEFNYANWIEAIRAGRTFVTNGPLIFFTVNGQDPGAVLDLPSLDQPVRIIAQARGLLPIDRLELILNGEVFADKSATGSLTSVSLEMEAKLPAAGWLAARCSGPTVLPVHDGIPTAAHTAPVYVRVGGRPPPPDPAAVTNFLHNLDHLHAWVQSQGPPGNGHSPKRLLDLLENARSIVVRRARGEDPMAS